MVAKLAGSNITNYVNYLETKYNLNNRVVVITDGTDIQGLEYADSIISSGGIPVILGNNKKRINNALTNLNKKFNKEFFGYKVDISNKADLVKVIDKIKFNFGKVDVLINNLIIRPRINTKDINFSCPEDYPLELWKNSLKYNLTGTFLTCQQFGKLMLTKKKGVILNIVGVESLLGINHHKYNYQKNSPLIPPIDYTVAKASVINLTRYVATYWAKHNIRANCLVQGNINQDKNKYTSVIPEHIPLNRLAGQNEFNGGLLFLVSDASSYMTGSVLVIDGGTTAW